MAHPKGGEHICQIPHGTRFQQQYAANKRTHPWLGAVVALSKPSAVNCAPSVVAQRTTRGNVCTKLEVDNDIKLGLGHLIWSRCDFWTIGLSWWKWRVRTSLDRLQFLSSVSRNRCLNLERTTPPLLISLTECLQPSEVSADRRV